MSESSLSALYLQNPQLAIALRRRLESEQQLQQGSSDEPVRHWAQGVNRLAQGLLGGYGARKADEEIQTNIDAGNAEVADFSALAQTLMGQRGTAPQGTPMQANSPAPQANAAPSRAAVPIAAQMLAPEAKALLTSIYGAESPDYNVRYGGSTFDNFADHPRTPVPIMSGPMKGQYSTAAGRPQFLAGTWDGVKNKYQLPDFSPQSQDMGAWYLARDTYQAKTGRDLLADLKSGDPQVRGRVTESLRGVWPSMPGGNQPNSASGGFWNRYTQALGGSAAPQNANISMANGGQNLPPAAIDPGSGGVPRETPAQPTPMSAPQDQSALMQIYMRGMSSNNPRVQRIAQGLAPFLKTDTPNLQTVNVGGEVRTFNPRTGTLGPALGSANEFTPKPQAVVDQAREIGAPYPELPRTPARMEQELALRPPTTLSPGQTAFGQNGQPIASVPNRPQSVPPGNVLVGDDGKPIMNNPDRSKDFQQADALRGEYTKLTADYRTVQDAHQKMLAAASKPSGAGDMALIFGIMKMLDPGSTVREGEYATAQNSGSVPERITAMYNKAIAGERLAETVRQDFLDQGNMIFTQQRRTYDNVRTRFEDLAKSFGLDPKQVTIDYVNPPQASAPTATPPGQPVKRSPDNPLGLTIPGAR